MWVFDFEKGSWAQEKVGSDGNATPQVLSAAYLAHGEQMLGFTGGGLFGGGTASRYGIHRYPETTREIDSLVTSAETFTAQTQSFYLGSSQAPATVRHLYLRVKQRGANGTQSFNITPYADNVAKPTQPLDRATDGVASSSGSALGDGVHRLRVDLGFDAYEVSFTFSHAATGAPLFDIEEAILDFQMENPR
jgi:hypothetical protein